MSAENRGKTLINILYFSVLIFIGYLVLKYLLVWLLPFVIGFSIAAVVNKFGQRIADRTNIKKQISSLIVLLLFYSVVICAIVFFGGGLFERLEGEMSELPNIYNTTIEPTIEEIHIWTDNMIQKISPKMSDQTSEILVAIKESAGDMAATLSSKAIGFLASLAKRVPDLFLALFFTLISSFLMVWDYEKIATLLYTKMPAKVRSAISICKRVIYDSALKMLKAYSIIMLITFGQLLVGFWILGIEKAVIKAVIIAFVDFLPLFGLGIIFVPWILILLIQKKFILAIGLAVLFLVISLVRNFIEPKIVGKEIGLNPIVSLMCFYLGLKFFGIWGIFILPIVAIMLKSLNEQGVIKLFDT